MEFNATFLVVFISFIVFVFAMNMLLYKPILDIMQKRKEHIDGNYKSANENDEMSETISSEIEDKTQTAKGDARNKYEKIIRDFKDKKTQVIAQAQQIAKGELEKSNNELANISNDMKQSLKGQMSALASDIVEKIIGYRCEINDFDNNKVDEILYK